MTSRGKLVVDGEPRGFPSTVWFTAVDPRYFRTMGIFVTSGRDFSDLDAANAPRVTIVSESFARMLANGKNALGHGVIMPRRSKSQPPEVVTVVGVVPDVVTDVTLLEPLAMYFPLAQHDAGTGRSITIRATTDVDAVRREVLSTIKQLDSGVALRPLLTLRERINLQMSPQRLGSAVLGALGGIALLLTILGTYVLADSMATLRMHEMGIRAALGATGRQLGALILTETARLVGLGLAVGLALAWLGASTLRAFLFQVQPLDPSTLASVAAMILTVTLVVALRPALRASRLDLARVLKDE
jgi:putative ABC transport system permease protein